MHGLGSNVKVLLTLNFDFRFNAINEEQENIRNILLQDILEKQIQHKLLMIFNVLWVLWVCENLTT